MSGRVDEDALVWEPSGGPLVDPLLGRKLLFLASQGDGLRDLYRATVRVSREGRPISISRVCNLTNTPFGDEAGLVSRGRQAAFITHAFEVVQAATVLHLDGPARAGGSLVERVLLALDNWLWIGRFHLCLLGCRPTRASRRR